MKLLITSDIHQYGDKWSQLIDACSVSHPDIVAIAGDLFPFDNGIRGHIEFFPRFLKYAQDIKEMGIKMVIIMGNDDNILIHQNLVSGDGNLWHYVTDTVKEIDGFEFVGVPYVPDYPFAYKAWCRGDSRNDMRIDPMQYSFPITINKDNKFEAISNLEDYYKSNLTIDEILNNLSKKVKNMDKSIWLIHAPPSGYGIDVCQSGKRVGSESIKNFIEKNQPFLTLHGHIHESPYVNNSIWWRKIGNTYTIQQGQMFNKLYYVTMEIENYNIKKFSHSIYGEAINDG